MKYRLYACNCRALGDNLSPVVRTTILELKNHKHCLCLAELRSSSNVGYFYPIGLIELAGLVGY